MFGKRFKVGFGGLHLKGHKNTVDSSFVTMQAPKFVTIFMQQHVGTEALVSVKVSDEVFVGSVLGEPSSECSSYVHSSVAGTVKSIKDFLLVDGTTTKAVVIETSSIQENSSGIRPPVINGYQDFFKALKNSGIVGLGGNGFPTYKKLSYNNVEDVETLIINACESEPYITSDSRTIIDNADKFFNGLEVIRDNFKFKKIIVGIEEGKKEAIEILKTKLSSDIFKVVTLKNIYPQGNEKILLNELTGKKLKIGENPQDHKVVVLNVSTIAEIGNYIATGMPLVSAKVTVSGDAVRSPKNVIVPIGTSVKDLFEFCKGTKDDLAKVLIGGVLSGDCIYDLDYPILKNNKLVLGLSSKMVKEEKVLPCIKCQKCVMVCPVGLMPPHIDEAYKKGDTKRLLQLNTEACISCGACSYVCPSKRPVFQSVHLAKSSLNNERGVVNG